MNRTQNIQTLQGQELTISGQALDSAGSPIDLSGHTISLSVFKSVRSLSSLYSKAVTGDAQGNFTVTVSGTDTASVPCGCWIFKIQDTVPGDDILLSGAFIVAGMPQ